jgi:hypothetical protein
MASIATANPLEITFQTFLDYAAAETGTKRLNVVKSAKKFIEDDSDPFQVRYFYLGLRNAVRESLNAGGHRRPLDECLRACQPAKLGSYTANVEGLKRWLGRKTLTNVGPVAPVPWSAGGIVISVNPEFGGQIAGVPHVIKLHFKEKVLTKRQIDSALRMLQITHEAQGKVGILDVRRAKLHTITRSVPNIDVIMENDAVSLVHLWTSV